MAALHPYDSFPSRMTCVSFGKASFPISVTVSGIRTFLRLHQLKAWSPMLTSPSGSVIRLKLQLSNACCPIYRTLSGITMLFRFSQRKKVNSSIASSPSGRRTSFRDSHHFVSNHLSCLIAEVSDPFLPLDLLDPGSRDRVISIV